MATSYTTLLGLALPVQGELSGTWGDTVNDYITQYLDAAVAGTQTISGSLTAVTLSKTTNASLSQAGTGATGSSQYQIINCTGNPGGLLTITAPAASKAYLVLNNTSTNQSVKVVGSGPTTGVTVAAARCALIAWNGSDFELVASTDVAALQGLGTGVATALGVNVGTAGAFVVNGGALGTPSSGTVTNLTGTASININGTVGATTPTTGAFTTLTTSSTVTLNGGTANGVAYLNGSKVLTTGSALTFDGTNFATTGTTTATKLVPTGNVTAGNGMYLPTTNTLAFSTAGSERVRVDSSGNVGIGTNNPGVRLQIQQDQAAYTYCDLVNVTNGGGAIFRQIVCNIANTGTTSVDFAKLIGSGLAINNNDTNAANFTSFGVGASERMRIDSSGNVGIGTSSPGVRLDVNGALRVGLASNPTTISNNSQFYDQQFIGPTISGLNFTVRTGSSTPSETFRIGASGNVGIGTSSPSYRLHVVGSGEGAAQIRAENTSSAQNSRGQVQVVSTASTIGGGLLMTNASDSSYPTSSLLLYNYDNQPLVFGTNNTERARIDSSGNLFVGTTSAFEKFAVYSSGNSFMSKTTGDATLTWAGFFWHAATTGNNQFVEFGTEGTYTARGSITYNRAGGLVAYNTTSDYRAKDIIGPVQNSGEVIDALKVYEGVMKGATQSRPMLVAHEAQAVVPYAVTGEKDAVNKDGTPKFQQMDISSLVPLLLAEIQSLRKRLAAAGIA